MILPVVFFVVLRSKIIILVGKKNKSTVYCTKIFSTTNSSLSLFYLYYVQIVCGMKNCFCLYDLNRQSLPQ